MKWPSKKKNSVYGPSPVLLGIRDPLDFVFSRSSLEVIFVFYLAYEFLEENIA